MGVPQSKVSKGRRDRRRSHHGIDAPNWITCPACGESKLPHRVCPHCGVYKGKQVVQVIEKKQ